MAGPETPAERDGRRQRERLKNLVIFKMYVTDAEFTEMGPVIVLVAVLGAIAFGLWCYLT